MEQLPSGDYVVELNEIVTIRVTSVNIPNNADFSLDGVTWAVEPIKADPLPQVGQFAAPPIAGRTILLQIIFHFTSEGSYNWMLTGQTNGFTGVVKTFGDRSFVIRVRS